MKRVLAMVLILGTISGAEAEDREGGFFFFDSSENRYTVSQAPTNLMQEYDLSEKPVILTVATSHVGNGAYREQHRILKTLDAEKLTFLHVVADASGEYKRAYWTDADTARKLLDGKDFRLILTDSQGEVIFNETGVIEGGEIRRIIKSIRE